MGEKIYIEGRWIKNVLKNQFEYYNGAYIAPDEIDNRKPDVVINQEQAHKLVKFMEKQGFLHQTVDDKVRNEDLKITHRLLDIMESKL
ncbi:hypothetical protein [Orenia marismortui]|uniref:Uncharacterized protein n=1 Tax=Orenia marismortui TaxID=46469 RepID=A0A4R8GGG9_9FIRM|nr:hypothetical protein [Orenia marismortui]TDX44315.1 hypothetical protein C7959_1572 [Orenia marismortui]